MNSDESNLLVETGWGMTGFNATIVICRRSRKKSPAHPQRGSRLSGLVRDRRSFRIFYKRRKSAGKIRVFPTPKEVMA
jgi:hypothetical protein